MKPNFSLNARLSTRRALSVDRGAIVGVLTEVLSEFRLDLDHYGVDSNLMSFPDSYNGRYFGLIEEGARIVGTFALFPLIESVVEIGNMYLHRALRGNGRGLLKFIEDVARKIGFMALKLDSSTVMKSSRALFEKIGFIEIKPLYYGTRCQHRYIKQLEYYEPK